MKKDGAQMSKITVKIGALNFLNPVALASGILSHGSLLRRAAEEGAGAVVTKSLTLREREGYKTPTIVGAKAGLINAIGLANPGYKEFLKHDLPMARQGGACVIVSIAGGGVDEFRKISIAAERAGADGVELNLSCPHVKKHGLEIGSDPPLVKKIVREVRGSVKIPVHAKLGLTDNLTGSAIAAESAGADAIVAINTIRAVAIDVNAMKPVLSNTYGGLSGPAIHPIAVRCVYDLYKELSIPIIGCGGVEDSSDALEFILAGATAVQVGTAVALKGLTVFKEIAIGIDRYLDFYGFKDLREIVGLAHRR